MHKKYLYSEKYNPKLEQYIKGIGIRYKIIGDGNLVAKLISFAVNDDELPNALDLQRLTHSIPIVINEFTQKELYDADYLTMRPRKNIVNIVNAKEAFLYKCPQKTLFGEKRYEHKEQVDQLQIKNISTKGKTSFFCSMTGFSEIFAKKEVCELMQNSNITGLQMRPVILDGMGSENTSGLYQLCAERVIPSERIFIDNTLKVERCPTCGSRKLLCKQDYQLQLIGSALDLSDDFYMTESIYGEGISFPLYVISQRLYRLLVKAKAHHNVAFEPVVFTMQARLK